jgi:hypothetical protein
MNDGLSESALEMLRQPLNITALKERDGGGGKKLKYIKGDGAIDTANKIFGFGRWGYKVVSRGKETIANPQDDRASFFYTCDVELSVTGSDFTFPGSGVGIVGKPFTTEAYEKAYKEAETDACKRALRHYGDQFGLSLYDENDVVVDNDGNLAQVKDVRFTNEKKAFIPKRQTEVPVSKPVQDEPPTLAQLKARCDRLFGVGKWDALLNRLFGVVIADDKLSSDHLARITASFDNTEKSRNNKNKAS